MEINFKNILTSKNLKYKLRLILVFLIVCTAFSIPFGDKYARTILTITFILWLFFIKIDNLKLIIKNKIIILLFVYISSHYITLLWSENIDNGLHIISQMWRYIFLPIVLYITILKRNYIQYVLFAFIAGMFVNEIISYLIYFDIYQTEFSRLNGYPVGFINHIYYSVLVAFCAVLILYQSRNMTNPYLKIIYTIFFITMTLNLVISGGRTGYVAYFGTLIILLFTYYKFNIKNFLQILLFPILVFYIGYQYNSGVQARFKASANALQQISNKQNYNTGIGQRLAFYPLTKNILEQGHNSFLYGVGTGDIPAELKKAIIRTKIINNSKFDHVHNIYLAAYLNIGIFAIFLLILFYYLFKLDTYDSETNFIKYLFLLIFMMSGLSDDLLATRVMMIYFSLFIGIIISQNLTGKIINKI